MPESEFQALMSAMNTGFNRVYDEIGSVCARVQNLEMDKTAREAAEKVLKEAACAAKELQSQEDRRHINWYQVRQGAVLAACTSITVAGLVLLWAGVKFLSLNMTQWVK